MFLGKVGKFISGYTALFPEGNNLHGDSCGSLRSPKRISILHTNRFLWIIGLHG